MRVGNVYYYFTTKDQLVQAAIDAHAQHIQTMLASFDRHRSPKARLKAFVRVITDQREVAARYGCPHGTLCSELSKHDDLEPAPAIIMQLLIAWAEQQCRRDVTASHLRRSHASDCSSLPRSAARSSSRSYPPHRSQ